MADVLLLSRYDRLGASSRIRSYQFLPALAASGIDVAVCPMLDDEYLRARATGARPLGSILRAYARRVRDVLSHRREAVVWLEYEALPWLPDVLERALLAGARPLVVDYDDAIFHRYDLHRSKVVRALLGDKIRRIMRRASVVITGNDYLATYARDAGAARVEVIPSVIDISRYRQKPPRVDADGCRVGWIGSPSTVAYLRSLEPVFRRLSDIPGLRVVNIGGTPWTTTGLAVENRPWSEATEVDDILSLDIGIMPLPDEPWERGKCGFKLIQYMGCALPVVASPVGANAVIVEHGRTGFLAASHDEWIVALRMLLGDPALRDRLGRAGYERARACYSLEVAAPRLGSVLTDALALARTARDH